MKKTFLVTVGLVLAIMVAFAGCGEESKDPAQKVDDSYKKAQEYESLHSEFDMQIEVDGDLSDIQPEMTVLMPIALGFVGSADMDISDEDSPAVQAEFSIEGLEELIDDAIGLAGEDVDTTQTDMLVDLLSDMEIRLVENTLYLSILGEWYEADMGDLSQADVEVDTEDTECARKAAEEKLVPSAMLTNLEEVGSEDVDGESTTHYKAGLDLDKAFELTAEIARECGQAEAAGGLEGAEAQLNDMFKKLEIEMWIDGDDNMRQMKITMELDMAALASMGDAGDLDTEQADALESLKVSVVATMTQSNFNEDVEVEAPSGALPMEDLLSGLGAFGGLDDSMDDFDDFEDIEDLDGTGTDGSTTSSTTTNPFST